MCNFLVAVFIEFFARYAVRMYVWALLSNLKILGNTSWSGAMSLRKYKHINDWGSLENLIRLINWLIYLLTPQYFGKNTRILILKKDKSPQFVANNQYAADEYLELEIIFLQVLDVTNEFDK